MKWISLLVVTSVSAAVQAREWSEFYTNARSQAMGGVKIALSSDDTSLFRNPANLGSIRGYSPALLDPEVEISEYLFASTGSSITDAFNVQKVSDALTGRRDQFIHAKMQITPSYSVRNFGIGLIYKNEMSAIMASGGTTMDTLFHNDVGVVVGYNTNFWDGRVKLGISAKAINRIEVDDQALETTQPLGLEQIASEGTGFGADVGIMFQAPVVYFPTLAVVVRDVGSLKFNSSSGERLKTASRPNEIKQSVDAGISLMPIHSKALRSVFSIEYRDLANAQGEDFVNKRLHAGIEFNWSDLFYLRLGMNQNYPTAGVEVASERLSWQFTTYGEEVGTKVTPREDRRYSTKISLRF